MTHLVMFIGCIFFGLVILTIQGTINTNNDDIFDGKEYHELKKFDENIQGLQDIETFTFQRVLSLILLYYFREERWKQGGYIQSLTFTNRAIDVIKENPQHFPQEIEYSLYLHAARLHSDLGTFDQSLLILNQLITNYTHDSRKLSDIYLLKGDVLLSSGQLLPAFQSFNYSQSLFPCQHKAYYKMSKTLQSIHNMDTKPMILTQLSTKLYDMLTNILLHKNQSVILPQQCYFTAHTIEIDIIHSYSDIYSDSIDIYQEQQSDSHEWHIVLATFYWSLYLITDQLHNYQQSWYFLQQARYHESIRLTNSETNFYNQTYSSIQAKHIQHYFQSDYWPKQKKDWIGLSSKLPIFIVGFFRSGSTLLETLLDSHPNIWGMGENSPFNFEMYEMKLTLLDYVNTTTKQTEKKSSLDQDHFGEKVKRYGKNKEEIEEDIIDIDEIENNRYQHSLQSDPLTQINFNTEYSKILQKHGQNILTKMQSKYQEILTHQKQQHQQSRGGSQKSSKVAKSSKQRILRIVDKMLLNYRNIALIHLTFPNAIILHTIRDPLDTLLSCLTNRFGDFSSYTLQYETLIQEYILYLEVMHHFRQVLPFIKHENTGIIHQPVIDIQYEELVSNPNKVLSQIYELIDISMISTTNITTQHLQNPRRTVKTASYLQVKQPINTKSIGQWKKYESMLQEMLIPSLKKQLKRLQSMKALPFMQNHRMNWELDSSYNYSKLIEYLSKD